MRVVVAVLFSIATASQAAAAPVSVRFEGSVTAQFDDAPIPIGAPFSGTYTFDPETAATHNGDPTRPDFFLYNHFGDAYGGTLEIGSESYFSDQPFADGRSLIVFIYNDDRVENDRFHVTTTVGTAAAPLFGSFYIILDDSTRTALDSAKFTSGAPDLAAWESSLFGFNTANWTVHGTLSSIQLVPEPATGSLILLGLLILGHRSRQLARVRTLRPRPPLNKAMKRTVDRAA